MTKNSSKKTKTSQVENGARRQLIEELFYDFNRSKVQVFWMNFTRGLFFGFGTVLGGTVVVAIIVWLLAQSAVFLPDWIAQFINQIIDSMQK